MKLQYRAIEGTNHKTRRLSYLTAMTVILGHEGLSKRNFLQKICQWSQDNKLFLEQYIVKTGEITSTKLNSAALNYTNLGIKLGLIAPISGYYRNTRIGLVLSKLSKYNRESNNPFDLTGKERLFFLYQILNYDTDILLSIIKNILEQPKTTLAEIQKKFQSLFLARLTKKISLCQDELLQRKLLDKKTVIQQEWLKSRYSEHLVPPRLNWLLDLGFLDSSDFKKHRYTLTKQGRDFILNLPHVKGSEMQDISRAWLAHEYWQLAADTILDFDGFTNFNEEDTNQIDLLDRILQDTFSVFRKSFVPKVSLIQALLYISIRLLLEHDICVSPDFITKWLSLPRTFGDRQYVVRQSPRENESYLIFTNV